MLSNIYLIDFICDFSLRLSILSMDFVEEDDILLQGTLKVVTHQWIVDSVRLEKELSVAQYEIPRGRL